MSDPLIELRGASRSFGLGAARVNALFPTETVILKGEFICVAGPSGSGKTTLLNLAGLLDRPSGGEVYIMGAPTAKLTKRERADLRREKIGFVFQEANLLPVLTARENVEFALELRGVLAGERRKRAQEALALVSILDQAEKYPAAMSGGQRQRAAIARAVAMDPCLIIADEPTASLDGETGQGVLDLLSLINREKGTTFLFSSHDQKVIDAAHRVLKLKDGKIT